MRILGELTRSNRTFLKRSVPIAAFIAALCCFTPVVIVLIGLGSVSYAASLNELLYGEYWWAFQLAGFTFLVSALVVHLYTNENVCSMAAAVRKRRRILNLLGVAVVLGATAYVLWMVVVELVGLALGIM